MHTLTQGFKFMNYSKLTAKDERLLWLLLIGIIVFNFIDFLLTSVFLSMGYRELNPVMDLVVHTHYFPLIKLVMVPVTLLFVWEKRHHIGRRILVYAWVPFLAYFMLMVHFTLNLWWMV